MCFAEKCCIGIIEVIMNTLNYLIIQVYLVFLGCILKTLFCYINLLVLNCIKYFYAL